MTVERLLRKQHAEATFARIHGVRIRGGGDGRGYVGISAFLKLHARRHHPFPEKFILREDSVSVEDRITPRGFWHHRRNSAMLCVIKKTELED